MKRLREALDAVHAADQKAIDVMREEIPLESTVFWMHGDHERQATVCDYSAFGRADIRVRSTTGKTYWLCAGRVTRVEVNSWIARVCHEVTP